MKRFIITFLVFAAMISSAFPQAAQDGFSLGITGSYNRSIHSMNIPVCPNAPKSDTSLPYFNGGSSNGYSLGLSFELPVTTGAWSLGFIGKLSYESLPVHSEVNGPEFPALVPDTSDHNTGFKVVLSSATYNLDFSYKMLSAEMLLRLNLFNSNLGVILGPSFSYELKNNYTMKFKSPFSLFPGWPVDTTVQKDNCGKFPIRYEDNFMTAVYDDGPLQNTNKFRLGLTLGLQYEIFISGIKIVPFASYNFGVTEIEDHWRVNAFKAGVDARIFL